MISLVAADGDNGKGLIDFISEKYPKADGRVLVSALKKGNITLGGKRANKDDKVQSGDSIRLFLTEDVLGAIPAAEIVYQDENIIIVDKPAGLQSISEGGEPNAIQMVEEEMKKRGEYSLEALIVPYLIYPIEKYASGLLILAKHEDAYLFMAQALSQRRITRYFTCLVTGQAKKQDELLAYHFVDKASKKVRIFSGKHKEAKPIVTRYTVLSSKDNMALLSARPITNYLHQVRAHLAFEGLPVLGDEIYGSKKYNKKYGAGHVALWLKTIVFETGTNNSYAYLNGKKFESLKYSFPKCVYDAGLVGTD